MRLGSNRLVFGELCNCKRLNTDDIIRPTIGCITHGADISLPVLQHGVLLSANKSPDLPSDLDVDKHLSDQLIHLIIVIWWCLFRIYLTVQPLNCYARRWCLICYIYPHLIWSQCFGGVFSQQLKRPTSPDLHIDDVLSYLMNHLTWWCQCLDGVFFQSYTLPDLSIDCVVSDLKKYLTWWRQ